MVFAKDAVATVIIAGNQRPALGHTDQPLGVWRNLGKGVPGDRQRPARSGPPCLSLFEPSARNSSEF